jgi:hypothetical protein
MDLPILSLVRGPPAEQHPLVATGFTAHLATLVSCVLDPRKPDVFTCTACHCVRTVRKHVTSCAALAILIRDADYQKYCVHASQSTLSSWRPQFLAQQMHWWRCWTQIALSYAMARACLRLGTFPGAIPSVATRCPRPMTRLWLLRTHCRMPGIAYEPSSCAFSVLAVPVKMHLKSCESASWQH